MGTMTHYMGLLADNQPWNLLIFMAIPVICAETVAITELGILFTRNLNGSLKQINKAVSIFAGIYFTGIFVYLVKTSYPPYGSWTMERVDRRCSGYLLFAWDYSVIRNGIT